jgi:hypothetical protein
MFAVLVHVGCCLNFNASKPGLQVSARKAQFPPDRQKSVAGVLISPENYSIFNRKKK